MVAMKNLKEARKRAKHIYENSWQPEIQIAAYVLGAKHQMESEAKPPKPTCDVCGSENIIEAPHMGRNCNDCHPI